MTVKISLSKKEKAALKDLLNAGKVSPQELKRLRRMLWEQDYDEEPVSFREFLESPAFLHNIGLYDKWKIVLTKFFMDESMELILQSSVGSGKTTVGCVALLYQIYKLLCLKDPSAYYGLLPGFPIVFGLYNIYKYKAGQVVLDRFRALLNLIPWFQDKIIRNLVSYNEIVFKKNIKVIIGAQELDALGEDLYGCIIDEVNFMKMSTNVEKMQALKLYNAVRTRIISRFHNQGRTPGLVIMISSKRVESDFLNQHIERVKNQPKTMICNFALWEVKPDNYSGKTFKVQVGDRFRTSKILQDNATPEIGAKVIDVPIEHLQDFQRDIDQALRDIANIATFNYQPLIPEPSRLYACIDETRPLPSITEYAVASIEDDYKISDFIVLENFVRRVGSNYEPIIHPGVPRYIHLDLSQVKDYTGLAIVHHDGYLEEERVDFSNIRYNVYVPKFYVDLVLQIRYGNSRIDYSKIRDFIFYLKTIGYNIAKVTADSYQSADFIQILSKAGLNTQTISVDKTTQAYMLLREIIMGKRLNLYKHTLLIDELLKLEYHKDLEKVDHPANGSKDLSDSLAGSIWMCYNAIAGTVSYKPLEITITPIKPNVQSVVGNDTWILKDNKNYIIDNNTKLGSQGILLKE